MALIYNPTNGEMRITEDPESFYGIGWRQPTMQEAEHFARTEEYGGFAQQAQAQAERVVRGATLGAVEGFGAPEDIRARAEVSQELSPVTSAIAGIAPDVGIAALTGGLGGLASGAGRAAGRAALAEGAGIVRAGLSAARAGGAAALAGESLGSGLVAAGQDAYSEGRQLGDDPGLDAENVMIWGGLNFGIGAALQRVSKIRAGGTELEDVAKAAEFRAPESGLKAEQRAASVAPLDDVRLPDVDGDLVPAAPGDPGLVQLAPEIQAFHEQGIAGMSLRDLRALPLEGEESAAKVAAFAQDEGFVGGGKLPSPQDNGRGGLPAISLFPDEPPALANGRHRLEAARQSGQEFVVANVKRYDGEGNTLWDYVGPVRVNPPRATAAEVAATRLGKQEAVDAGVERAVSNASRGEADDLLERAIGGAPEAEASSFGRQRRLYINREPILDAAEREMAGDLGGLADDIRAATKGDKAQAVSKNVSANHEAQRAASNAVAEDAATFAGELRAEARQYAQESGLSGLHYPVPGQKDLTLALMDHAKAVSEASTGKGMFQALDDFKRKLQETKLGLEKAALNSENTLHYNKLIPKLDTFEKTVRASLEDAATWGKAGEMQRAYNAVISDRLMPSMDIFEKSVLQKTDRAYTGDWKMEGWEKKIRTLLKGDDPGKLRHVNAVLDGMDELAGVRRQFGDETVAKQIEARTAKVRRTMGLAAEVADATERMKAIGGMVGGLPMGGAIAGGIAGGLPGAAIGAALPNAVRGFVMGDLITAFQRLSGATETAAQRGVDDWIRSSRLRGGGSVDVGAALRRIKDRIPTLSPEAKQLRDVAARRGVSHSMALFMGDDESPGAAFERWRGALLDQESFLNELGEDYGSLQTEAPEVFMALGARADTSRRYLLERMPPNVAVSMVNPEGYPPSRDAIEDWSVYVNAVRFPGRVVRNIGGVQMQEIEALRTTAPRMHETLQRVTLETLARAQETGEKLDDAFLARIPILFPDLDGAGSPVFSREFGTYVRDYKAAQQNGAGSKGRSNPRPHQPNPMMATIQGGATFGTR